MADSRAATRLDTDDFIAELKRWRDVRGLSQRALAAQMNYNPSYITKIETGSQPPTHDFANTADEVLRAGGALFRAWREYDGRRKDATRSTSGHREPERVVPEPGSSGSLMLTTTTPN
jgi:transcriptional regulator with XRE-family HTH domain